jgi:hypothetical protein
VPEAPEVIMPLPASFQPLKSVRSTLIISSYGTMRDQGYGKAYLEALPAQYHRAVLDAVAGVWLPVDVALAHYNACGMLGLAPDAQIAMGRKVGERMHGTLLGTVVRMAKGAGVSPYTVIPQFQRFWDRAFDGGGLHATKVGPKEVHIGVEKAAIADSSYWRSALCGLAMGVLDLFCQKSYMQELGAKKRVPGCVSFRIQWA